MISSLVDLHFPFFLGEVGGGGAFYKTTTTYTTTCTTTTTTNIRVFFQEQY